MLSKTIHSLSGVFSAAGDAPRGTAPVNVEPARKPSNLVVRAALKRRRLAAGDASKTGEKKPV